MNLLESYCPTWIQMKLAVEGCIFFLYASGSELNLLELYLNLREHRESRFLDYTSSYQGLGEFSEYRRFLEMGQVRVSGPLQEQTHKKEMGLCPLEASTAFPTKLSWNIFPQTHFSHEILMQVSRILDARFMHFIKGRFKSACKFDKLLVNSWWSVEELLRRYWWHLTACLIWVSSRCSQKFFKMSSKVHRKLFAIFFVSCREFRIACLFGVFMVFTGGAWQPMKSGVKSIEDHLKSSSLSWISSKINWIYSEVKFSENILSWS